MKNLYLLIEKNSLYNLNTKRLHKCILRIKLSRSLTERQRQDLMFELYCVCSSIIMKAVNNFYHLTKNYHKTKIIHTREDIAMECYIGLNNCVKNMKLKDYKKFHFYLNSGLNRIIYRLYQRNYLKHSSIIENTEESEFVIENTSKYLQSVDLTEIDLKNVGLTDIEMKILVMRVEGIKFQDFLRDNKMSQAVYRENMENLKNKVTKLYKDDEY